MEFHGIDAEGVGYLSQIYYSIGGGFIGAIVFFGLSYLFNLSETRALAAPILRRLA